MPALKNPRHEAFAQSLFTGLSEGLTRAECYSRSGYTQNPNAASACSARLLNATGHIVERVRELQEQAAAKAAKAKAVTIESIVDELDEAREMARSEKQASAMIAASQGKAKVTGLEIQRVEQGKPGDFSGCHTRDEIADSVLRMINPDVEITPDMHRRMLEELDKHTRVMQAIAHGIDSGVRH